MAIQIIVEYKGKETQVTEVSDKDHRNEYNAIKNELHKKIKNINCQEHDFDSNLIVKTLDFDDYTIDFQACCEPILKEMETAVDILFQPEHRKSKLK